MVVLGPSLAVSFRGMGNHLGWPKFKCSSSPLKKKQFTVLPYFVLSVSQQKIGRVLFSGQELSLSKMAFEIVLCTLSAKVFFFFFLVYKNIISFIGTSNFGWIWVHGGKWHEHPSLKTLSEMHKSSKPTVNREAGHKSDSFLLCNHNDFLFNVVHSTEQDKLMYTHSVIVW